MGYVPRTFFKINPWWVIVKSCILSTRSGDTFPLSFRSILQVIMDLCPMGLKVNVYGNATTKITVLKHSGTAENVQTFLLYTRPTSRNVWGITFMVRFKNERRTVMGYAKLKGLLFSNKSLLLKSYDQRWDLSKYLQFQHS